MKFFVVVINYKHFWLCNVGLKLWIYIDLVYICDSLYTVNLQIFFRYGIDVLALLFTVFRLLNSL